MIKKIFYILKLNKFLIATIVAIIFFAESCDFNELSRVEKVNIITETKLVVPLAYGTIDAQNVIDYVTSSDPMFTPDKEGVYTLKPIYNEFNYPDTFALNNSILNIPTSLELRIETENRIPIGIQAELSFLDSLTHLPIGLKIKCDLLKPADVNTNGIVNNPSHHIETVTFSKEQFSELKRANSMIVKSRFYLYNTQVEKLYIKKTDSLTLNIGIVVEVNLNSD